MSHTVLSNCSSRKILKWEEWSGYNCVDMMPKNSGCYQCDLVYDSESVMDYTGMLRPVVGQRNLRIKDDLCRLDELKRVFSNGVRSIPLCQTPIKAKNIDTHVINDVWKTLLCEPNAVGKVKWFGENNIKWDCDLIYGADYLPSSNNYVVHALANKIDTQMFLGVSKPPEIWYDEMAVITISEQWSEFLKPPSAYDTLKWLTCCSATWPIVLDHNTTSFRFPYSNFRNIFLGGRHVNKKNPSTVINKTVYRRYYNDADDKPKTWAFQYNHEFSHRPVPNGDKCLKMYSAVSDPFWAQKERKNIVICI